VDTATPLIQWVPSQGRRTPDSTAQAPHLLAFATGGVGYVGR